MDIIGKAFSGVAPEVAGPLGIFDLATDAAKQGVRQLVLFIGISLLPAPLRLMLI